jgi:hypothetical protein
LQVENRVGIKGNSRKEGWGIEVGVRYIMVVKEENVGFRQ